MVKNIIISIAIGMFLMGCGGKKDDVSFLKGAMPEESWTDYKKRIESEEKASKNQKTRGLQVKKEYIPADGVKGSVSYNGRGLGAEVHDESNHHGTKTVVKLFGGTKGPDYEEGRRDEKENDRRSKEQGQRQLAIDLAEEHAASGYMSYVGVPGQYYREYERAYESLVKRRNQGDFNDYRRSEYDRGVEDYRAKNPDYGKFAHLSEKIEAQARGDARAFRYKLPGGLSPELEKVYYEVFVSEARGLLKEKAQRDAKMEIFDPPYDMPDLVKHYERAYQQEIDRLQSKNDRRRR